MAYQVVTINTQIERSNVAWILQMSTDQTVQRISRDTWENPYALIRELRMTQQYREHVARDGGVIFVKEL